MDKSWMSKGRLTREFAVGLESFLEFAKKNAVDQNYIPCICARCGSVKRGNADTIRAHVYVNGIDLTYERFIWHGEKSTFEDLRNENDVVEEGGNVFFADETVEMTSRSKRGRTYMTKLSIQRNQGNKMRVRFNSHGAPLGKEGTEMQSYIGVQVRERVRIIYSSWKQVPEEDKESIWEAVNFIYDVDRRWRKHCLMSAGQKWRQFKVTLTSFVMKAKERGADLTKAPGDYYIPQEDWNSFVLSRLSEDFMRLSELQKERQKANKYPHHLARKGYARLEQDLESELCDDEDINRAVLWKMSRCNKNGEFEGEELQETVKKIDDLIAQKKEGKLAFKKPTEDLLTAALNSEEHSGRVRGIGGSVTPSVYFGVARGKKVVDHDLYITQQKELIETRKKVSECESRLQKVEALLYSGHKKVNAEHEEKASCTVKSECDVIKDEVECEKSMLNDEKLHDHVINEKIIELKQGKAVALSLESTNDISAYGTIVSVNGPGQFLGGIPMPSNCMCVSIDHAMDENALLPVQIPGALIHGRGLMKELEEDVFGQSCGLYVFQG
ncbi:hypothetical protein DH2020_041056 [Rehmannia glutinosa]|uniref:Transposase-associated domain-containing protein n=1 Tax=Rehmannia glutinosa TaxID=99300 RepID=A0ABR0UTC1_REHGL